MFVGSSSGVLSAAESLSGVRQEFVGSLPECVRTSSGVCQEFGGSLSGVQLRVCQ